MLRRAQGYTIREQTNKCDHGNRRWLTVTLCNTSWQHAAPLFKHLCILAGIARQAKSRTWVVRSAARKQQVASAAHSAAPSVLQVWRATPDASI